MKTRIFIIALLVLLVAAACSPVTPATEIQDDGPDGVATVPVSDARNQDDTKQPADQGANAPAAEAIWKNDPQEIVIRGTFCCGFSTPVAPLNYIPDFQIWGDGRYIWVEYREDGSRVVWQAQLSQDQLKGILEDAIQAGFFDWKERYENNTVADFADKCLSVQLESQSKKVCEYFEGAPQAFHDLYDRLASGMGMKGSEFVPERAYLVSYPVAEFSAMPLSENDVIWPADKLFPLTDAEEKGVWVEGEALELAWRAVNQNPWAAFVREGSGVYQVSVQVPGLSFRAPPTR